MLGKDLLGLYDASVEDIQLILDTAVGMKKLLTQNLKKLPHLQGRTVTTLFYENSTRTRRQIPRRGNGEHLRFFQFRSERGDPYRHGLHAGCHEK